MPDSIHEEIDEDELSMKDEDEQLDASYEVKDENIQEENQGFSTDI